MRGLTFLRSVSYCAISYCNPNLTPSSVTISNQDYLVLAVTIQSPTCGRDDRALRFPPLRLLCYSTQSPWCMSASLKRSFLYSGHGKKSHGWRLRKRSIPLSTATFSSGLYQPTPNACRYQRLSLPGFVLTKCLDDWRGRKRKKV
jgi:hypothetical protein